MKIIALTIVKDEGDIIYQSLIAASAWADYVIVMNNNSQDNTEQQINLACSNSQNIIYWGRYDGVFRDGLRALMFLDNKKLFDPGDWIVRLDADEFYFDNPRHFIERLPKEVNLVFSASYQYSFTEKDLDEERKNPEISLIPANLRMKYYQCNWSEIRLAKIGEDLEWDLLQLGGLAAWPTQKNPKISSKRIKLKHYKYRSIDQIKTRISNRVLAYKNNGLFPHDAKIDFDSVIVNSAHRHYDDGGELKGDYSRLPDLEFGNNFKIIQVD